MGGAFFIYSTTLFIKRPEETNIQFPAGNKRVNILVA